MREHLQQRLKAKNNLCNSACDSPSGSRSSSSNCNIDGYAELDYLVQYIEGHNTPQRVGQPNPKRAAKKARQKEKKVGAFQTYQVIHIWIIINLICIDLFIAGTEENGRIGCQATRNYESTVFFSI